MTAPRIYKSSDTFGGNVPPHKPSDGLGERMVEEALHLAANNSLERLAEMVAESAPSRRRRCSTHAKVPWALVYAIRIKMILAPGAPWD